MKKFLLAVTSFMLFIMCSVTLVSCGKTRNENKVPETEDKYENAKVVKTADEFITAINEQKDGDVILLEEGTYDIDPTKSTLTYSEQTNWYIPVLSENITIAGKGNVVLTSTKATPNGAWASQNFITVIGDNFTMDNITVVCKTDVNKAIEILGKNITLKNVTFNSPENYKFAGSVYFNNKAMQGNEAGDIGTATFENVTFNKGRITASGATAGKFVFKKVQFNWYDIEKDLINGFYPILNLTTNRNKDAKFNFEGLESVTVTMSSSELGEYYDDAKAELPKGVKLIDKDNK